MPPEAKQLFRDQKSGVFQLEDSGLREPERMDRLLLMVAIAVLAGSLQGYALSLAGLRRQVAPHWKRGMSFLRLGLGAQQMLGLRRNAPIDGLAADSAPGAGALHPQPQSTAEAGPGLVLTD